MRLRVIGAEQDPQRLRGGLPTNQPELCTLLRAECSPSGDSLRTVASVHRALLLYHRERRIGIVPRELAPGDKSGRTRV